MCEHRHHVANKDADSSPSDSGCPLWQSTCAERPVCARPGISLTELQERKGLDGEERAGEWSPLYCMSEISLGYTSSQINKQQTNAWHRTWPPALWVGGQVLQSTQWDSGQHSSLLSVVWAWSRLQPGREPSPHSHRPEASSCRNVGAAVTVPSDSAP